MTLLKQKGYHNWSYEHISLQVGIKKASIHYYFPRKDDLVAEVVKIYINDFFMKLDRISKSKKSNYEKLQAIMACYKENYTDPDQICLCTILAADYHILSPEILTCLQSFYQRLDQWIARLLDKGKQDEFKPDLDTKATAQLIVNALQGLLVTSKITGQDQTFDLCTKSILDQIVRNK